MCESPLKGISVSLRDASLYHKEIGRRRVTLEEVHSQGFRARRSRVGEYVEVRVLHSFVVKKKDMYECNFILADETDYVAAIAFCAVGSGDYDNLPEIYNKLKVNLSYRIHNFQVDTQTSASTGQVFLLRRQVKRIHLNSLVRYIEIIPSHELEISRSFKKYIPFVFTKFCGVDRNLDGKLIDFVAFVKHISFAMLPDGKYQRVLQLSSTMPDPSNSPIKITTADKHLYLKVYERLVDVFLTEDSCYIFSNIKVKDCGSYGLKLYTSVHSVIVEIPLDNIKRAFPDDYQDADFIAYLYNGETSTGSNTDESQGSDDSLRLSQLERPYLDPKAQVELSLSPHTTAPSHQIQERPLFEVEPSTNPEESRISPNKRNNTSLESTSPPKKICQTPSQPLTEVLSNASQEEEMMPTPDEFYDCINGGYPYEVNVKLATSFMDNKPGETYSTRSEIRGVALIINNVFDGEGSLERRGTLQDVKRLRDLLMHFGFLVLVKTDLQSWELRETIQKVKYIISEIGASQIDSLFVAVLSHGELGTVQMRDEINIYLYNDLIHPFDEQNFPDFEGKPKIFVIQTCQRHPNSKTIQTTRNVLTPPERTGMKNVIVCQGACPGQFSYRNPKLGTYMIYVLVFVMMRDAHNTHFEKMMRSVQKKMDAIKWDFNKELTSTWMPYHFKKMYFNPGLFGKKLCAKVRETIDRLLSEADDLYILYQG